MSDVNFRVSVDAADATQGLQKVNQGLDNLGQAGKQAQTNVEGAAGATERLGKNANVAGELLKGIAGQLAAAFTFKELVDAAAKMESVASGLKAVSGSATVAAKDMEFIRTTANKVGADVTEVGKSFLSLAAATKGTAVEGEPTRAVFEAVADAMGKAGKSSAETSNALTALAQIASKGTVSMEELRGQLGEALPGALNAAASGLGITTKDLIKLVEEGQIAADDLFPALTKGLKELYGGATPGAQTLAQEIANIKNAFVDLATNIGENGGLNALKTGAEVAQSGLVLLDDALITTGKTIGVLAGAISTLDFSQLPQAFADIEKESRDKLLKAAEHNETLRKYVQATGNEAITSELKFRELQKSTAAQGEEAAKTGTSMVALAAAYGQVTKTLGEQIEAAEKNVVAKEAEGKAAVQLADLMGSETELRRAQAKASQDNAEAASREAEGRLSLVNVLKAQRDAIIENATNAGTLESETNKKRIEELDKLIEKRQAESDKATGQAASARVAAAAAQVEAEALKDNGGRVEELRAKLEALQPALLQIKTAREGGLAVTQQQIATEIEAAKTAALLKDAIEDQRAALESNNKAKSAQFDASEALIKVAIAQQRAAYDLARAQGDEAGAAQALTEIKKLELQLLELTAQAKRAEAEAARLVLKADIEALRAKGDLTEAQKADIAAREARIRVLEAEAQISDITAKSASAVARAVSESGQAGFASIGGIDAYAESLDGVASSAERATGAVRTFKAQQKDDGRGPITGTYQLDTLSQLKFKRDAGTLKAGDLDAALNALQAAKNNYQTVMSAGPFAPQGRAAASYQAAVTDGEQLVAQLRAMAAAEQNKQQRPGSANAPYGFSAPAPAVQAQTIARQAPTTPTTTLQQGQQSQKDLVLRLQQQQTEVEELIRRQKNAGMDWEAFINEGLLKELKDLQTNGNLNEQSLQNAIRGVQDEARQFAQTIQSQVASGLDNASLVAKNQRESRDRFAQFEQNRRLEAGAQATQPQSTTLDQQVALQKQTYLNEINRKGVSTGSIVNITIGGARKTVRVSSDQDAQMLAAILAQIENDRRRGGG